MDEPRKIPRRTGGAPAYMTTFADLMTLLLCFFVLLLSFSEMDVEKYKQIAGSVRSAFGVQNRLDLKDIPKGTSVVAQEYRPGRPDPTPVEVIQQQTADVTLPTLYFQPGDSDRSGAKVQVEKQQQAHEENKAASKAMDEVYQRLKLMMERENLTGGVELEMLGQQLLIRMNEGVAFAAGSAFLQPKFRPVVADITALLNSVPGQIRIIGHTDDRNVDTTLFRSAWDLSAQRAASIAIEMEKNEHFNPVRLEVIGVADSEPRFPNDSEEHRRQNRRVEILVLQGKPTESGGLDIPSSTSLSPAAPVPVSQPAAQATTSTGTTATGTAVTDSASAADATPASEQSF
ncbi:MotB family protein [Plesiomonas sp. ZOR0011]|uniref:MotB family protein n=1 Tax=Plesiomonas sp. ZOR0011 TaxID=1339230 RepID=UPI000907D0A1|nr:MotB family protein [Plesiomonas sp. ZOR0011]